MAKSADAFRTISEVADWLETPAHVLRFWESKFSQVKPVKRAGGRRYYRPSDMLLLGGIKKLLHHDGMTIKGVQKLLREQGIKHVAGHSQPLDDITVAEASDAAIEVEASPAPAPAGKVVNFQRETEASSAPAAEDTPLQVEEPESASPETAPSETGTSPDSPAAEDAADTAAPGDQPAAADEAVQEAGPPQDDTPDETPVMPSFSHRPAPAARKDTAPDEPATETPPSSAPRPKSIDVPDDPADDIPSDAGVLSQVAALQRPVSPDTADRLRQVLDRLRQGRGANGQSHGS